MDEQTIQARDSRDRERETEKDTDRKITPVTGSRRAVNVFFGVVFVIYLGATPFLGVLGVFLAVFGEAAKSAAGGWAVVLGIVIVPGLVIGGLWAICLVLTHQLDTNT